jgi:hypothetical protein
MLLRRLMLLLPVKSGVQRAAQLRAVRAAVRLRAPVRQAAESAGRQSAAGELAQEAPQVAWPQQARAHLARLQAQRHHHHHQCRCCFRQLLRAIHRQQPRHQPEQQFLTAFPMLALESLYQLCRSKSQLKVRRPILRHRRT